MWLLSFYISLLRSVPVFHNYRTIVSCSRFLSHHNIAYPQYLTWYHSHSTYHDNTTIVRILTRERNYHTIPHYHMQYVQCYQVHRTYHASIVKICIMLTLSRNPPCTNCIMILQIRFMMSQLKRTRFFVWILKLAWSKKCQKFTPADR